MAGRRDRGQAFTLEGTAAAIVVVMAVLFGLQAVDTGPWTGTPDRQPDRLATQADDLLAVADEQGVLSKAVRCYGTGTAIINGGVDNESNTAFEQMLEHTFDAHNREYELYVSYWNGTDGREEELVSGTASGSVTAPDPGAGVATRRFALYDDDPIRIDDPSDPGDRCDGDGPELERSSGFFIPNVNDSSKVYNVVEVRLIVW